MMNDLISRQAAIDAINSHFGFNVEEEYGSAVQEVINSLPSAQPDLDEWCTDCKEYNQEKHCCPRWNRVIRKTLKDAQPEPKLIRCRDCKYTRSDEFLFGENYCTELGIKVREDNYCSWGTRKEVEDE